MHESRKGKMETDTSPEKAAKLLMFREALGVVLEFITETSVERCKRWHGAEGLESWSGLEWAGAMAGEAGEAANVAKKLKRIDDRMRSIDSNTLFDDDAQALVNKFGKELADVFHYMILCAARYQIKLDNHIISVFNQKSEEYGFPERL